uniref:Uncharacterized protein n=2 Tax=Enterobacteriaceae TaxID=543 RepID=A0A5P1MSR8_ECOLX|nr:Helix-turn-helix domain of resolvase [Klebsiella pneumoniae]QEI45907.1 hypothetical protein p13ZX36-200_00150 [Escherichia coli]WKT24955.1 hypothetical protein AIHLHEEL_00083 [Escherichia coli]
MRSDRLCRIKGFAHISTIMLTWSVKIFYFHYIDLLKKPTADIHIFDSSMILLTVERAILIIFAISVAPVSFDLLPVDSYTPMIVMSSY